MAPATVSVTYTDSDGESQTRDIYVRGRLHGGEETGPDTWPEVGTQDCPVFTTHRLGQKNGNVVLVDPVRYYYTAHAKYDADGVLERNDDVLPNEPVFLLPNPQAPLVLRGCLPSMWMGITTGARRV